MTSTVPVSLATRSPSNMRPYLALGFALILAVPLGSVPVFAADQFSLEVRGQPELNSVAVLDGNQLTITDATGRTFRYVRDVRLDSRDGVYAGFQSGDTQQQVQWPTQNTGRFFIRDGFSANWRPSRQRIQHVGMIPVVPPVGGSTTGLPPAPGTFPPGLPPMIPGAVAVAPVPGVPPALAAAHSINVRLSVANRSGEAVDIVYLDRTTGKETSYFQLNDRAVENGQGSFPGHLWFARGLYGRKLSEFMVLNQPRNNWSIGPRVTATSWTSPAGDRFIGQQQNVTVSVMRTETRIIGGVPQTITVPSTEVRTILVWTQYGPTGALLGQYTEEERTDNFISLRGTDQVTWIRLMNGQAIVYAPLIGDWQPLLAGAWGSSDQPVVPLPTLVNREVVPNPPLSPANVILQNRHSTELLVRIVDRSQQAKPQDVTIASGGSTTMAAERDAGATLVETYTVPLPTGGATQQVVRREIPPAVRYDIVVATRETTYTFKNSTNAKSGGLSGFAQKGAISLGVIQLPPGAVLRDGHQVDLYADAVRNRNPGAAGLFQSP